MMRLSVAIVLAVAVSGLAHAGELTGSGEQTTWASRACVQPIPPAIDRADAEALNRSISLFNTYVASVDAYNQCLSDEAAADIERLAAVINNATRTLQNDAIAEAEAARAELFQPPPTP